MTTTILKYPLRNSPGVNQNIVIKGALVKVLTVQMQGDIPTLWALVHTDPDIPDYSQSIYIITLGTGWEDDFDRYEYISTVQDKEGFVWHYFMSN